jgi:Kef-type K+ transport system membrane component KefB
VQDALVKRRRDLGWLVSLAVLLGVAAASVAGAVESPGPDAFAPDASGDAARPTSWPSSYADAGALEGERGAMPAAAALPTSIQPDAPDDSGASPDATSLSVLDADLDGDSAPDSDAAAADAPEKSGEHDAAPLEEPAIEPAPPPPPAAVTETRPAPLPEARRPRLAVQTILGLLALLALAYVANHPRVRRIEEALGLRSAITAGFPFVALGMAARHPALGVLTDRVLVGLGPLVDFGLGWLGFLVGFRFDLRRFEAMPRGAAVVMGFTIALPFVAIASACGAALMLMGVDGENGLVLRSAILLGTAGAMSAPYFMRQTLGQAGEEAKPAHYVDEIVGVAGLALIAAYFRPTDLQVRWALPGTGWLFVTLGLGATLGVVLYVILRRPATQPEFMAIALGSVGFAAGMAAYLRLSPLVICFVAGTVIANLPGPHRAPLRETLATLERPIFLVFLTLAGALWDPRDWRGWALVPVFLVSRYVGLLLGRALGRQSQPAATEQMREGAPPLEPLSIVAIAVVINVSSLYRGPAIPVLITAVIAGALLAEVIAAFSVRRRDSLPPIEGR